MEKPIYTEPTPSLGHSKWGISALIVSLVMSVIGLIVLAGDLIIGDFSVQMNLVYCIYPVGILLGLSLAIAGLREKNRKKVFPVLGLLINLAASCPMLLMWALGLMQGLPFSYFFP